MLFLCLKYLTIIFLVRLNINTYLFIYKTNYLHINITRDSEINKNCVKN